MPSPKEMAWVRAPTPCNGMIAIDLATVTFNGHLPPTHVDAAVHRDDTVGFDDAHALGTASARGIEQTTLDGVLHRRRRLFTRSSERRSGDDR